MKSLSQVKTAIAMSGQVLFLLTVFVFVGLLLPMQIAPAVFGWLPVTTPMEAAENRVSFQIDNRNVTSGESAVISVSDPKAAARIRYFSYECVSDQVELAYPKTDKIKKLPCGTKIRLPNEPSHELIALTSREEPAYVPLNISIDQQDKKREISVVIAAGQKANTDSKIQDQRSGILR